MKYLTLTAAATALLLAPTTANAQFFGGFDNSSVLGGLTGAGIGGAIGSNLAGSGNRDEGTAIGAVLGGLAGTAYGNSRSNFYGNPYAGSFNPGFSGNSLLGTALGAGIGGAIGSNLAGSGVRQEGTAIGAVLGGLAGNALSSRSRYGNQGFGGSNFGGGNFAPVGFGAPTFGTPNFGAPSFGGGFSAPSYGPGFGGAPFVPAAPFGAGLPSAPMGGTSFVPGGFVNAGTFANTTTILPPAMPRLPAPAPVYQPAFTGVTYAAPNVTLAGPSTRSISTRYSDIPSFSSGSTVTQDYVHSTGVSQPLVLRRAPQQRVVIKHEYAAPSAPAPISYAPSSYASAPSGQSIHADTVNINYGNNSQVGTTSSNNGSTVGNQYGSAPSYSAPSYSAPSYSAPSAPIDFGDGIGDGTWGHNDSGYVDSSSYTVGTSSILGGYESPSYYSAPAVSVAPSSGESYYVGSGQSFQVPSAGQISANCATSTFGCAGSYGKKHKKNTASYGSTGSYSYCNSDKVYNDEGALLLNASPVCR